MRFPIFLVLSALLAAGPAWAADSVTLGGTAPSIVLSGPSAGQVFASVSNSDSTISYSTDSTLGFRKITVGIEDTAGDLPTGTKATVTVQTGLIEGSGKTVTLSTTAGDLIRDISSDTTVTDLPLIFEFTASLEASPASRSRTLRYTILMQ